MLSNLVESRRRRSRPGLGATVSAAVHAMLVILAVNGSGGVEQPPPRTPESIELAYVSEQAAREAPRRGLPNQSWPEKEVAVGRTAPVPSIHVSVPREMPGPLMTIDLDSAEFGVQPSGRTPGSSDGARNGGVHFAGMVEQVAVPLRDNPSPEYPASLKAAGIDGYVLARFIVDTTGRAEPRSLRIVESSDEAFSASVHRVLPRLRFEPARVGQRRVRMLVEQSYVFRIER